MRHGFIKVAAAAPVIKVADADYNADRVIECINSAEERGVKLLVYPELTLTGCTCGDIITHQVVLDGAKRALKKVVEATVGKDMLVIVGLPVTFGARVFSAAAQICMGDIINLSTRECVDGTPFSAVEEDYSALLRPFGGYDFDGCDTCLSARKAVEIGNIPGLRVAVEIGADKDAVMAPSVTEALDGATVIARMASCPQTVYSLEEAELSMKADSKKLIAGIVMACPGVGESTTDNTYSGLCMVAENGEILACEEGEDALAVTELDIQLLINARRDSGEFDVRADELCTVQFADCETELTRKYRMHPHLPADSEKMPAFCRRMLDIQVNGLIKRMKYAGLDHCVVGISGGVDSTLCVMVCAMAVKKMGLPATNVVACTLPCFGTSSRTKSNAIVVAEQCGCEVRVIDIGKSVYQHFDDIGHAHDDYTIAFENAQARERTQVLMDIANKVNGLDVGTEDLSEFIDGWCTYNGDHTSMYDVNLGLTKTHVREGVRYIAATTEDKVLKAALYDVLDCPVTPELLPIQDDMISQKSEDAVGSYSLQDFFTYYVLQCGFSPAKTIRLAEIAYKNEFTREELIRWMTSYCKRLFSQQFKRSCLMDGPAVMDFTVSPRCGLHLPSDGECALFLKELEEL